VGSQSIETQGSREVHHHGGGPGYHRLGYPCDRIIRSGDDEDVDPSRGLAEIVEPPEKVDHVPTVSGKRRGK
jgi:hypothetical protein